MCIIVAKNKGVELPTKKTLKQCFERNKDGAGIMYVKDNKVIIEKGLMTFQEFYQKLRSIKREFGGDLTNKAIVMHFRIGTHGENDKATTHPFPISSNFNDLRATYFETDIGMVHNGIISAYNYDSVLSDTQTFIRDYVSVFKDLKKNSDFPDTIKSDYFADKKLEKISPEVNAQKREEFDDLKKDLKRQWEEKYGIPWPKYTEDVYSSNGKLIRQKGHDYDAHHIQPLNFSGKNVAENITPIHAEKHYDSQGVHSPTSPYSQIEKLLSNK